ncbi:hypothetical protein SAMN05421869_125117 [Nonomuraea jiangxiensis]|uniref:Uncharacterized protein n=1 Tax=Nonomuraea jiangxiensis TaxID=633440 RepID=A0A1G9JQC1_9ACTN|nr:hypothetical protein SAMN05421869_125117 [Nonomuraea jiangxiensis]
MKSSPRLPGSTEALDPARFPFTGLPFALTSTVLAAGCGSAVSNEEAKSPGGTAGATPIAHSGNDSAVAAVNRRSGQGNIA